MTRNQIDYLNLERQKATDAATLAETHRANFVRERQNRKVNRETKRHNLVIEANQQKETAAGLQKSIIASQASKYAADSSRVAAQYSADSSASASRYAADKSYEASGYAADRRAQATLTNAQINKEIAAARDAVNKAINDDNINAAQKRQLLSNASNQFIKALDKEIAKYKVDKEMEVKWAELELKLANSVSNFDFTSFAKNTKALGDLAKQIAKKAKSVKPMK